MPTYLIDKETRELITKREWMKKYGEPTKSGLTIINRKFEAYESPITGEPITSFRQREQDMKAAGCLDYEPSLKAEIDQNAKVSEQKLELEMERSMDQAIKELPARMQELLEQELISGADISVDRQ